MNNDVVIIKLDRPRKLKFTHTALKTLSAMTSKTIEELDEQLDISNFEFLEQMIYCGLLFDAKENGETLKIEQIPDLLDQAPYFSHPLEQAVAAWRVAFGVSPTPETVEAEGNLQQRGEPPENEKDSTGKNPNE